MLFAIGTRVRFRFTGETGIITALLAEYMLQVKLDSDPDLEIPAFEEDLVRDVEGEPASPGAKFVQKPVPSQPAAPPRREVKSQYVILKSKGIQLAFEPMPGRDGSVSKYKAWLINDTGEDVLADFRLYVGEGLVLDLAEKLGAMSALDAGDILFDDLNESPEVEFSCQRFTTAGLDAPMDKYLKIKAKQFFNRLNTVPVLNVLAYNYVLLESPLSQSGNRSEPAQDLKEYAKQKARSGARLSSLDSLGAMFEAFNVEEFAHFEPEIDLHIEKLTNGYAKMDKGMMLRLQLSHFEKFMQKAIRLGAPKVFIIHGVGEGKLKEAIAQQLRDFPEVHKFKNEFHPKYGYGATEVIFH